MKEQLAKVMLVVLASALMLSSCTTTVYTVNAVFKNKVQRSITVESDTTKYTYVKQTKKVLKDFDVYKTSKIKDIGYMEGNGNTGPVVCVTLEDSHVECVAYANGGECFNTSFALGKPMTYKSVEKKFVDEDFYIKIVEKKDSGVYSVVLRDTLDNVYSDYVLGRIVLDKKVSKTNTLRLENNIVVETKTVDAADTVDITFSVWFRYYDTLVVFDVNRVLLKDSDIVADDVASVTNVKVFDKRISVKNGQPRYMLKMAKSVVCYDFTLTPMETYETFWVVTDKETYDNTTVFNSNSNSSKWEHSRYFPSKYVYNLQGIRGSEINVKRIEK